MHHQISISVDMCLGLMSLDVQVNIVSPSHNLNILAGIALHDHNQIALTLT